MKRNKMNRMCSRLLTMAGVAVLGCSAALAQSSMGAQQPNSGNMNGGMNGSMTRAQQSNTMPDGSSPQMGAMQDKKFAKAALAGGMAEVELGQLAEQKSNSEDVKKFGARMVEDHTKLNDQMKPIAASLGVQPPTELMPKDKELMTKLQGLSGDAFDKVYIRAMLKDHKKDEKDFEMEASMGQNQQEKDAAKQGAQMIKEHLQLAENLAKAHDVTSGKSAM